MELRPQLIAVVAVVSLALGASDAHGRLKVGCTGDATKLLVRTFARNYTGGRVSVIVRLWAPEPRFRWFSSGPPGARLGPRAYDRATLAGYFRARVRKHERLRLTYLASRTDGHAPTAAARRATAFVAGLLAGRAR